MGWLSLLGAGLKLFTLILGEKFERDKMRREERKKSIGEVREGLKRRDRSLILDGFARHKRMR